MRTKILTTQIFVLFLSSILLMAQDNKSIKEKLNNVKGDVNKITISTEDGDITFTGDEAKDLFKRMKSKKMHKRINWISEDGEDIEIDADGDNVMIFKSGDGEKHIIKKLKKADNIMILEQDIDDIDILENGKFIKVKVEEENGEKNVEVTTTTDGKKEVKTYTGKEADEYLEKMKDEHDILIDVEIDDDDGENVWIHKSGDSHKIEKNIKVELEDGKKKLTVTTIEDGEEKVEVYEGDEADEYLENESKDNVRVKIKEMKDGKKIIIKELKKVKEKK